MLQKKNKQKHGHNEQRDLSVYTLSDDNHLKLNYITCQILVTLTFFNSTSVANM